MKRGELLDKAKTIISGDREEHYGNPENNFNTIADLWTAYLKRTVAPTAYVSAMDVANLMILLKVARLASDYTHDDSWVDIAGYAACGSEIIGDYLERKTHAAQGL